ATPGDVEAFKYWRMADDRNPARVAAGTFAGNLAALNTLYVWAARMHRVENPIVLREVSSRSGRPAVEELAAGHRPDADFSSASPSGIMEGMASAAIGGSPFSSRRTGP
ncbi:MAG TPA: hypothetical protein VF942_03075, partial [Acidimicrobiales bacterium]